MDRHGSIANADVLRIAKIGTLKAPKLPDGGRGQVLLAPSRGVANATWPVPSRPRAVNAARCCPCGRRQRLRAGSVRWTPELASGVVRYGDERPVEARPPGSTACRKVACWVRPPGLWHTERLAVGRHLQGCLQPLRRAALQVQSALSAPIGVALYASGRSTAVDRRCRLRREVRRKGPGNSCRPPCRQGAPERPPTQGAELARSLAERRRPAKTAVATFSG